MSVFQTARNVVEDVKKTVAAHASTRRGRQTGINGVYVLAARITVLERKLADLLSHHSMYAGSPEEKALYELRDYWEEVLVEINP